MFKSDIVYEIGRMCATIHRKTYSEFAEVNENLEILKPMPSIDEQIYNLLNDKAGTYLQKDTVKYLKNYAETHEDLCSKLNKSSVLIHGDIRFNNILISREKVYFLDFEFARAGSRYMDIGHFFSRKDDEVEALMNKKVYDDFSHGYHEASNVPLPENWLLLSRFCDICLMLRLINRDNSPAEWVSDVEQDILSFVSKSEI